MSAAMPAFVRWQAEGEKHWRAGDYAWMAERVDATRVLEIGCGAGFGTLALARRGIATMVIEPLSDCIAIAAARVRDAGLPPGGAPAPTFLQLAVGELDAPAVDRIRDFAPEWVVCWLMGADESALDASLPATQAVQQHREAVHRQLAELAAALPSASAVHLVDRTAFPWKIKDTARETLVLYHQATTFVGLPFTLDRADTLYRKLDERQWPAAPGRSPGGVVPVLGSLIARRGAN
jgi:SAM-dependent methyltransferase